MNKLPKSRNENIVVQNLEKEVLIYDTITDKAYCLNETSANIFNACNGATSFDEFKRRYKYTDDLIFLALDELKEKNLLDSSANYQTPFVGMSRREVIRKVGLASMVALPVVAGIIAPQATNAASGTCTPNRVGCFGPGTNTAVAGGGNTGVSCPQACAPFGQSCCSCTVQFAIDRRPGNADCFCACQ